MSDFDPFTVNVASVTNGTPCVVVTEVPHEYSTGQFIRLIVPKAYGMDVNREAKIVVVDDTTFLLDIDTTNALPFVPPTFTPYSQTAYTQAQAVPGSGLFRNPT